MSPKRTPNVLSPAFIVTAGLLPACSEPKPDVVMRNPPAITVNPPEPVADAGDNEPLLVPKQEPTPAPEAGPGPAPLPPGNPPPPVEPPRYNPPPPTSDQEQP